MCDHLLLGETCSLLPSLGFDWARQKLGNMFAEGWREHSKIGAPFLWLALVPTLAPQILPLSHARSKFCASSAMAQYILLSSLPIALSKTSESGDCSEVPWTSSHLPLCSTLKNHPHNIFSLTPFNAHQPMFSVTQLHILINPSLSENLLEYI